MRRIAIALIVVGLGSTGWVGAQEKRLITDSDLLKFVWIADPQVSPDGSQVVFMRVDVNEKTDDYDTSLWIVPARREAPRRLTSGTRDTTPRWSPDGRTLAFVRRSSARATQPAQIFVLSLDGGEAHAVTDLPRGAGGPVWSPDGKRIAFSSTTRRRRLRSRSTSATLAAPSEERRARHHAAPRTAATAAGGTRSGSAVARLGDRAQSGQRDREGAVQLTSGKYCGRRRGLVAGWLADLLHVRSHRRAVLPAERLRALLGAGSRRRDDEGREHQRHHQRAASRRPTASGSPLAARSTARRSARSISPISLSPRADGTGTPRNLTAGYDFDINGSVGGDQRAPRGGGSAGPIWSADGRSIVIVAGEHGDANLVRVDVATGAVQPVYKRRAHRAVVHAPRRTAGRWSR